MPPETWLADDARPDYDYSTKSHMAVCLCCIACGPKVVRSLLPNVWTSYVFTYVDANKTSMYVMDLCWTNLSTNI